MPVRLFGNCAKILPFGVTVVAMVAIDTAWSAMRFRPAEKVGK
jgi:hypothetical protein